MQVRVIVIFNNLEELPYLRVWDLSFPNKEDVGFAISFVQPMVSDKLHTWPSIRPFGGWRPK